MTTIGKLLVPLFLAAGCLGQGSAYIVQDSPPSPREEVVTYRPGSVWVHGHWRRDHGRWNWDNGFYEREHPGSIYIEGRWQKSGNGHIWIDGGWRRHDGVVIRDHG